MFVAAAISVMPFAYAQTDEGNVLEVDLAYLTIVAAAIVGAILNVVRGYLNDDATPKAFSARKLGGALIAAVLAGMTVATTLDIATVTNIVALIIMGVIAGFSADFALSKAKK